MGREIKRVPLDFDWPLNERWAGFLNPYPGPDKCPHCAGSGLSPDAKRLSDEWYGYAHFEPAMTGSKPLTIDTPAVRAFAERNVSHGSGFYGSGEESVRREAYRLTSMWNTQWVHHLEQADVDALIAESRLWDFTRNGVEHPTAEQINEWSISGFGHDALNQYICVKAKALRLGVEYLCAHCDGSGEEWKTNAHQSLYESWQRVEPPTGDGYQVWETVSEGSPVSPVFATADECVRWLIEQGHSESAAKTFITIGHAPSLVMTSGGIVSGIDGLADITKDGAS